MTTYAPKELTSEQKQNTRKFLFLMDGNIPIPPIDQRPNFGPLTHCVDQLCEAYHEAGVSGFRKAIKALSIDQPILENLLQAARKYRPLTVREVLAMPE